MQIEAIGALTVILGLVGWFAGQRFAVPVFFVLTLLGAAAAITLTSLGDASIQPAYLLLGFLALPVVMSPASRRRAAAALLPPNAGFWLLLTAAYATLSAVFLPRIFAGATYVFNASNTVAPFDIVVAPLAPTSGNITQAVYFLGDVICFLVFYDAASQPGGLKAVVNAAIISTAINLTFAAIDVVTFWTGFGDALDIIRNAHYRMLDDGIVLGTHRIVGSFPEASTFAFFTVGFFAFCTKLWLEGVRPRQTGPLALLSLLALAFATSSTGYAATSGFLALLFVASLAQALFRRQFRKSTFVFVTVFPLLAVVGVIGLRLDNPAWDAVSGMVDGTIVNKMSTNSGLERARWNDQALVNFFDTSGLGTGIGSIRASSLPLAVLGNIGVIGALTYGAFLLNLFLGRKNRWQHPFPASCQSAARWACLVQFIGASVAASSIDLGLPFFIFAGLACAGPEPVRAKRRAPVIQPPAATTA